MITYSLQNLLLDDPELDHESFLGPVVRMRWIANLLRLAVLEEIDQLHAAAGEYTEHQAEIRRLRRSSMAPDAGRYYSVEGKANRVFKNLDPEQARQIVELWRNRQPISFDACRNSVEARSNNEPNDWDPDDPDEYVEDQYQDDDALEDDDAYPDSAGDDDPDDFEENDLEDSDEWPDEGCAEVDQAGDQPKASPPFIATQAKHQTRNTKYQTRTSRIPRFAGAAAVAAIMLFAALLGVAAAWFIKACIQPTAPEPAPADVISTTKIVPSAVPRNPISAGAIRVPVLLNTKHQTRNTNP